MNPEPNPAAQPQRIQRQRSKGWRLPENTVCVTRGTRWGNPFRVGSMLRCGEFSLVISPVLAVSLYRAGVECNPTLRHEIKTWLKGHHLACWCRPGLPCHADVLLRVANES